MLLVVNAGSSSLKLALFDRGLRQVAQARAERIGTEGHGAALREGRSLVQGPHLSLA